MALQNPQDYAIESGPMGPIGEGQVLILRVNRNCPWNQCLFCPVYKGRKFSARSADEITRDIDAVSRSRDLLDRTSWQAGLSWCFVGIESGGDAVLKDMRKGVTMAEHIQEAEKSLDQGADDALEKASRAVFAIKSKGVP